MKKVVLAVCMCLMAATAAFAQLATTIGDLDNDIATYSRSVTHVENDTGVAPTIDGVINTGEYSWTSGLVQWNGVDNSSSAGDGSDGPGDCDLRGIGKGVAPDNATDLSYTIYLSHDNTYIYLGLDIVDDTFDYPVSTLSPGKVDSIEIAFDGDDSRTGVWKNPSGALSQMNLDGGKIIIGGNKNGTDVDEDTADCAIGDASSVSEATMFGSFTLPDGTYGRFDGTSWLENSHNVSGPGSDVEFILNYENPTSNANRVLELRIPKESLGMTFPAWREKIIGFCVTVNDFDDGDASRDHQLIYDNAGENLDGTDMLKDVNGDDIGLVSAVVASDFDSTNLGLLDQFTWRYECTWPRFQLLAGPQPPQTDAANWEIYK